jgi:hypothetical protein
MATAALNNARGHKPTITKRKRKEKRRIASQLKEREHAVNPSTDL